MHADELEIDADLVRRLLAGQFPQWAELPLARVESFGTDFAIYRLGDERAVRLPRIDWAAHQPEREQQWLPLVAPSLPLAVPVPLATGDPGEGYPWRWSVVPWLPGGDLTVEPLADPVEAAEQLAEFVLALQQIEPTGAPRAGRDGPLVKRDAATRKAIGQLDGKIDTDAASAAWEAALSVPTWDGPPVWSHGDLLPGNLLAVNGRLSAVIDFGGLGVGDPAAELIPAWGVFDAKARDVFRAGLSVDEATWQRGRGLAISVALLQIPYYETTNPILAGIGRRMLAEAVADSSSS
jgi:aminoglycoside phosphotransferase (APT) family kinase protein